jgi:tetratricopeptide (TPR) repeat protein
MTLPGSEPLEELLAEAIAAFDDRGEDGLQAFLDLHPEQRAAIERGISRCREMGLLGAGAAVRDFPDRLGEFRLLRRLGSGGMGVVYEAEQESLGRRVALKVVRPELLYFEGARERFRREIDAVARLSHPAIVPVLASGEQDGLPWYAMELLAGRTAHEICALLRDRDPAALRGSDLRQALGVRHAHMRGIVHRDIKPSNVMLTHDGRTVLLDFGIAMVGGAREVTRTGNTPGSPAFMSPEQLRGDAVDERTDVYSLAATLWQLLTLVPPFAGIDDLQRIRDGVVPRLRERNHEVPLELEVVVATAMDRDRERRYHDIEALANDLLAVLQRRPIRARRLGLPLRAWRWCQRHRVAATVLGGMLGTAAVLPAVFAWRERAVNRELQLVAADAQDSLSTTLDAIWSLLVRVGDDRLRHVPAAQVLARQSLDEACSMYRALLQRHPENERLRGNAGDALITRADLLSRTGDRAGAEASLQESVTLFGGDRMDIAAGHLLKRANARTVLAGIQSWDGERAAVERTLATAERDLAAAADPRLRIDVQRQRIEVALKAVGVRDPEREATAIESELRGAIALARALRTEKPDNVLDARQFVLLLDHLATMLGRNDRAAEALPLLDEALALARGIPATAPIWPPQAQLVSDVLLTLGNTCVQLRDMRAVEALKECLSLRESVARDHPRDAQLRSALAAALHGLANLNWHQEQYDLVVERLDRAIELQRSVVAELPGFAQGAEFLRNHLLLRASALHRLGRTADLHAAAVELSGMTTDPRALRGAAAHWLRLGRIATESTTAEGLPSREQCHDRAMAALLCAERAGWGARNPLGEPLYEPLRARPEFQELQRRIAARGR